MSTLINRKNGIIIFGCIIAMVITLYAKEKVNGTNSMVPVDRQLAEVKNPTRK